LFTTYNDALQIYTLPTNTSSIIFFKDDSLVPCEAKAGGVKYLSITSKPALPVQVFSTWENLCGKVLSTEASSTSKSEKIVFFPNPADNSIHISKENSSIKATLKNILGQEVGVLENGLLNTEQLPDGVYFLSIEEETYPVIIKH
jgi:hypothetical protein